MGRQSLELFVWIKCSEGAFGDLTVQELCRGISCNRVSHSSLAYRRRDRMGEKIQVPELLQSCHQLERAPNKPSWITLSPLTYTLAGKGGDVESAQGTQPMGLNKGCSTEIILTGIEEVAHPQWLPPLPRPALCPYLMTSSSVQLSDWSVPSGVASALSREAVCTGVVSAEDSALSSLKGLWRCVGLLATALLLLASEAVECGQLSVSVRSPSAGTRWEEQISRLGLLDGARSSQAARWGHHVGTRPLAVPAAPSEEGQGGQHETLHPLCSSGNA